MERWLKYGAVVITILVLITAGVFWQRGVERSVESYSTKFSLSREQVAARKPVSKPLTERLILVVLDKIEKGSMPEMPFLNALQKEGAYRLLNSQPPFKSKPTLAVLSSGAWPEINGVVTDFFVQQIPADNLFRRIAEAELSTAIVGHQWWQQLNGPYFRRESTYYGAEKTGLLTDHQTYLAALDLVRHSPAELLIIHFPGLERPARVDRLIESLAQELTWGEDTLLVVTKDSLFALGNRISPGNYTPAEQIDVAPTIAALLGVTAPTEAHGRILWDILDLPASVRALLATSHSQYLAEFVSAYVETGGYQRVIRKLLSEAALLIDEAERFSRAAMYEAAFQKACIAETILIDTMHSVRRDTIWRGYWLRLPLVLLLITGLAGGIWLLDTRRKILLAVGTIIQAGFFWLFYLIFFARSAHTLISIGIPSYLALILVLGAVWGIRRLSEQTKRFSLPAQDYWSSLLDYSSAVAGTFAGIYLTALLVFLVTGSRVVWYYPEPVLLLTGKLMVSQAFYLTPALIAPLLIAYWDNRPKGTSLIEQKD